MDKHQVPDVKCSDQRTTILRKDSEELAARIMQDGASVALDTKHAFLLPAWYDEQKFRRGQYYFHANYYAMFVSKLSGLLGVLAIHSILRVLIMTGQSSHCLSAFKRYLDTLSHMVEWYEGDLRNPNSKACKSLLTVRGRHSHASRTACRSGLNYITQRDMALTQFGFIGFAVLKPHELGIVGGEKDMEGFIHFWRVIGHLMGIQDKFNLCRGSLETTIQTCQIIMNKVFIPALENPPAEFKSMSQALLEGMSAMVPLLDTEAFTDYTKILCGMKDVQPIKLYSRAVLSIQLFVHRVLLNTFLGIIFRPILNFNMWLSVFISQRFPFLAFLYFGRNISAPPQFTIQTTLASAN